MLTLARKPRLFAARAIMAVRPLAGSRGWGIVHFSIVKAGLAGIQAQSGPKCEYGGFYRYLPIRYGNIRLTVR
jgi:hypothetical protein